MKLFNINLFNNQPNYLFINLVLVPVDNKKKLSFIIIIRWISQGKVIMKDVTVFIQVSVTNSNINIIGPINGTAQDHKFEYSRIVHGWDSELF